MSSSSNFVVGIDLGTTNSALAHVDLGRAARLVSDDVAQLVGPGELLPRPTLPSFIYLAGEHELPPGALRLPWTAPTTRRILLCMSAAISGRESWSAGESPKKSAVAQASTTLNSKTGTLIRMTDSAGIEP